MSDGREMEGKREKGKGIRDEGIDVGVVYNLNRFMVVVGMGYS